MDLEIENNNLKNNNDLKNKSQNLSNELRNYSFSIDRFEDDYAVCENLITGEFINIKKDLLPSNAKEGSILKFENNQYIIDTEKTKIAQEEIKQLVNNLFKKK